MGFNPFEPQAFDAFSDWAQKAHREAFVRRRILYTPNTLTSHTTQGVFHKINPNCPQMVDFPPCDCEELTEWEFEVSYLFPGGGGGDVEASGFRNCEPFDLSSHKNIEGLEKENSEFFFFLYQSSGIRLTRKIEYPMRIQRVQITVEPPATNSLQAVDYANMVGPFFWFGATDQNGKRAVFEMAIAPSTIERPNPWVFEYYPHFYEDQTWKSPGWNPFGEYIGALVSNVGNGITGAEEIRSTLVPPGTVITVLGTVITETFENES